MVILMVAGILITGYLFKGLEKPSLRFTLRKCDRERLKKEKINKFLTSRKKTNDYRIEPRVRYYF